MNASSLRDTLPELGDNILATYESPLPTDSVP